MGQKKLRKSLFKVSPSSSLFSLCFHTDLKPGLFIPVNWCLFDGDVITVYPTNDYTCDITAEDLHSSMGREKPVTIVSSDGSFI